MNILVTGSSGFVGGRLVRALRTHLPRRSRLVAWGRGASPQEAAFEGVAWREINLTDAGAVAKAVRDAMPDRVYHLAALSSVQLSHSAARETFEVNLGGTQALADALRIHSPGAVFIFASTGEVYGSAFAAGTPVTEETAASPLNPYSRSKLAAEFALQDTLSQDCPVIALRLLSHTGFGQDERFVVPSFAGQIARIERGLVPPRLLVGDLSAERDFLDIDDVVNAYLKVLALADTASGFQRFNVASGKVRSIASILEKLASLSATPFAIEPDPARMRPSSIARTLCDASAFGARTGWRPIRNFDRTLEEVLNGWRAKLA